MGWRAVLKRAKRSRSHLFAWPLAPGRPCSCGLLYAGSTGSTGSTKNTIYGYENSDSLEMADRNVIKEFKNTHTLIITSEEGVTQKIDESVVRLEARLGRLTEKIARRTSTQLQGWVPVSQPGKNIAINTVTAAMLI